jgi:hypothetical protein
LFVAKKATVKVKVMWWNEAHIISYLHYSNVDEMLLIGTRPYTS